MTRTGLALALVLAAAAAAAAQESLSSAMGERLFRRAWIPAPSSTRANDGLGPLFNARSCLSCHRGLDRMPLALDDDGGVRSQHLVLRFSDGRGAPDPIYGVQLQTSAVATHRPEGRIVMEAGLFRAVDLSYGALAQTTRAGARDAPMLRGLGLLDDVPDEALSALEDPDDRDGDGVRGRLHRLSDGRIGRFGWKASFATLADQIESAFHLDLGMSTPNHPRHAGDCTQAQVQCREGPHGGGSTADESAPEIQKEIVAMLTAYLASIDAPKAASAADGADLFAATGCAVCHRAELPTRSGHPARAFTDLLLHDLGPERDGGATEPGVAPTEWRTAPLWGLSRTLARGGGLLHDGRAKSVEEAVALHGGTAAKARARFIALPAEDKRRLIDYVGGL